MTASVQARLDLVALENGIARFGTAEPAHAVAVLDVLGAGASLATADDATQEELLAGRAQFLNAQTAPFQVLVRAEPIDLESHLRRVRARAEALPEPLASVARDYASFVQALAHQRTCWSATATSSCPITLQHQRSPWHTASGSGSDVAADRLSSTIRLSSRPKSGDDSEHSATRLRASSIDPACARTVCPASVSRNCSTAAGRRIWPAFSGYAIKWAPIRHSS